MRLPILSIFCVALTLTACKGGSTQSDVKTAGEDKSPSTSILETGAAALQSEPPIRAINTYLDGFHFYDGNLTAQMEAHHFCAILGEDFIQCVIYDGNV